MKTATVPVLLTLALYLLQDAASGNKNQNLCEDFRPLMKNGKLFCSQYSRPPYMCNNVMFMNNCAKCKYLLENEIHFRSVRSLSRATRAAAPTKLNCDDFKQGRRDGALICSSDASAVCGTNGKTYRNRCELCAENENNKNQVDIQSEGECGVSSNLEHDMCSDFRAYVQDGRLGCTRENDPIRGPDGRTHGNRCAMCAELFLKEARENATRERESRIRRDAEKELCREFENQVRSGRLFCTRESDPIRGPDGKMHGNKCALCADIFMRRFLEEKSQAEKTKREAEDKAKAKMEIEKRCSEFRDRAKNGTLFCTRENDPIRGLDGKTHGNLCSMCQAFFKAEAEEKKKAEAGRNRRGSENTEKYAKLCDGFRKSRKNGQLFCTRENDPIRGPDGKIHGNICSMCQAFFIEEDKARAKVKREAITDLCINFQDLLKDGLITCANDNDPVVGPDGKTHANNCALCATLFQQEAKENEVKPRTKRDAKKADCDEFLSLLKGGELFCTRENDPVRGPDGKTHGNKCAMCKAVFEKENEERKRKKEENQRITSGNGSGGGRGKAKEECAEYWESMKNGQLSCTRESDPVRGADGKSYNNKCVMCKELLQKEIEEKNKNSASRSNRTGSTTRKDICDQFRSQMKNGKLLCTRESDPTRGPDGRTHGNKCAMCKERLEREAAEKKRKEDEDKRNRGKNKYNKEDQCYEFRSMQIDGKLICTRENDPIRGPDGKMHVNKCAMCQRIFEREARERKMRDEENSNSQPANEAKDQCGEGYNTAENAKPRLARSSLPFIASISKDECSAFQELLKTGKFICTQKDDPVRGMDGIFYRNKCHMCKDVLEKEALQMEELPSKEEGRSEFSISSLNSDMCKQYRVLPRIGYLCPKNLQLVCGDDGQTYTSPCMLCHKNLMDGTNIHIQSQGKCEESNGESTPYGIPKSEK